MKIYSVCTIFIVNLLFTIVHSKVVPVCPTKCPSCMKCDPFKGTCILPRDFVSCTTTTGNAGVCYAGRCNTNLVLLPSIKALKVCETYKCNNNTCTFGNKTDGTDCTANALNPQACFKGQCKSVLLGLTDVAPFSNVGCIGIANGTVCDTNDNLADGETCHNNVCKFPDGTYYGYV